MTYVEDYVKRLQQIQASNVAGSMLPQPASRSELANLILQKARSDFSVSGPPSMPEKKKKSLGGKAKSFALEVIDKLARPSYAFNEAADVAFNEEDNSIGDVLKGAWRGLKGEDQTSYVDVLQHQYANDVYDSDEYKQIQKDYGQKEADWFAETKKSEAETSPKAIVGGTLVDFALDPLNLVGAGLLTKPVKALKEVSSIDKALEGAELVVRETPTSALPEATEQATKAADNAAEPGLVQGNFGTIKPTEGIKPSTFADVLRSKESATEFPSVQGKFASNRRPPGKMVDGKWIKADYAASKNLSNDSPRFAHISDVYNRDLRASDFAKLQKARNIDETAQVVDQVAKGNPAAVDLITNKNINPLNPVARKLVNSTVQHIVREITESVADPAKARALGKQPRHPVFNAPTQNNLSNKLANDARKLFQTESFSTKGATGIGHPAAPKFAPAVFSRYMDMLRNAEESLITKGREELNDAFYPRGGIKPDSPYLRLSDVLTALPSKLAQNAILGPKGGGKVLPSILLKAITGNKAALGKLAKENREMFDAVQSIDWTPLMVKEYATRTIDAANATHKTTNDVAGFIAAKMADESSDASKAAFIDDTVKAGKREFKNEMPEAKASLHDMLDGLRKSVRNPTPNIVDTIIERGKQRLAANVFDSKAAAAAQAPRVEAAAHGIEEVTQIPAKQAGLTTVTAAAAADNVFNTVLSFIKPDAGYKVLRPVLLKNISVRKSSAATRAHEIIKIFGMVPEASHLKFWNEVRFDDIPTTPEFAEPVALMRKMMGNMFGESGLADKFAGNTSLARAGLNIDHLNKHLNIVGIKDFKFERDIPDPLNPKKKVRLEGAQILDTWKNYQPTNSADLRVFTHNLTQAVENSMVEYSVWANAAALFSKAPGPGTIAVSGMHSAIDGLHVPQELAPQMGKLARGIDEMFESVSNSKLMRAYDAALRTWKTGVTIYSPSHHLRNMTGDVFLAWMDGLSNPAYYNRSKNMLLSNFHRYSDIKVGKDPLANILGEGVEADLIKQISGQTERIPKGTRVLATARIGGKKYQITSDQAYQMAYRHGLFPHSAQIEDLPGTETLMEKAANRFHPGKAGIFQPAKGKIAKTVRQASETREHYVRGAHWLYALENTKANSLEELFQKAADRVRKYHPDGLDLTPTEKKFFRRVMPFYSWTRKAIPLVLEGMVMNPHKILAYPKLMSSIQESQGIDSSMSDPWPDDQLFPDWLASNVIGPTIPWDSPFAKAIARSDDEAGYGVVDPGLPATQILEDYGNNPIKGIGNSLSPFLKIPAEIGFGRDFQSGAPIEDKTEYVDKNVPMLSTVSRLTNGAVGSGLLEGGDLKGKETEPYNPVGLINYLTGAGIIDTGRYKKGGEFDLKKRIAEEKKKNGSK